MRLKNLRRSKPVQLSMTSMIDVIFLLLIFFVVTANFNVLEELLPTNFSFSGSTVTGIALPEQQILSQGFARIRITYENQTPHWQVEGQNCRSIREVRTLLGRISRTKNDLPIIIASDANVPFEHVIDVYDASRAAGLRNIQFEVSQNSTDK